ncbi:MAG: hypothetical protein JWM68_373 [Verrucomicrobiales bacterium]|nr:hypothetical protein [Verrucomicrobiales bacterium]
MKPFFDNEERRKLLFSVVKSWIGTPFIAHGRIKGAGADCVNSNAEIYLECGLYERYDFPNYTIDGGNHAATSKIIEWLDASEHFENLADVSSFQTGDMICFRIGESEKPAWHCGIFVSGKNFVHCVKRYGVQLSHIEDPSFANRIAIYRPIQKEVV